MIRRNAKVLDENEMGEGLFIDVKGTKGNLVGDLGIISLDQIMMMNQ